VTDATVFIVVAFIVVGICLYKIFDLRGKLSCNQHQYKTIEAYSHIIQSYLEKREQPALINFFKDKQPVTVFGLSRFARSLIKDFAKVGIEVKHIIDNFNKQKFQGIETETLNEFLKYKGDTDTFIVICILRPEAYDIKQDLLKYMEWEQVKTIEEIVVDDAYLLETVN
jgi:hypothetical protein